MSVVKVSLGHQEDPVVAPRQCRRSVGRQPLCWWSLAGSRPVAPVRQRLARNGPGVLLGRRTMCMPAVHRAVRSVAGGIGLSFGFASQFLNRFYRKGEQCDVLVEVMVRVTVVRCVQRG